jgi:hypothetical protein
MSRSCFLIIKINQCSPLIIYNDCYHLFKYNTPVCVNLPTITLFQRRESIIQCHKAAAKKHRRRITSTRLMNKKMFQVLGYDASTPTRTASSRTLASNSNSIREVIVSDDDSSVGDSCGESSSRTLSVRLVPSTPVNTYLRCDSIESEISSPIDDVDSEPVMLGR